jgi:putative ABC transport system permease protein
MISRTREMGVRLAIGASPNSLIMFVLRGALVPLSVGLAAGVLAIGLFRPLAEAQLFKVDTHDPRTLALAAIVVGLATVAAAYLPARRVSKVDPVSALRTE